jgi:hypothetical protein
MELTRQGAFSLLLGFVSVALAVQLLFVVWMVLGIQNFVGVSIRKDVKKDLLWVQLILFVIGLAYLVWMEIAFSLVAAGIEKYVFFCISVYYQVAALLTGMFRTCFMIFLLLKLRAISKED